MRPIRSLSCALLVAGVLVSACTPKRNVGDACRAGTNDLVCTDSANVGSCRNFTWHVDPCRGPGGCASGICDQSVAVVNDSCGEDGARVCSTDGTQVLRCQSGTMVPERTCRGEHGCFHASPNAQPTCDAGPPQVGDACTPTLGSRCSADGKSILQCSPQTHHIILERQCLGPKGCFPDPHFHTSTLDYLACDIAAGDVGQPCIGYVGVGTRIDDGGSYCSTDGKELLTCKHGTLVSQRQCACEVKWDQDLAGYGVSCSDPEGGSHVVGAGSGAFLSVAEKP